MSDTSWLHTLSNLNVYRAKHGPAPHKPLLLLVILEMAERGELHGEQLALTPELAFQFDTFWQVVAHRRTQLPDVRMPFHHLGGDGLLTPLTESGQPSKHRSLTRYVTLDSHFIDSLADPEFRDQARTILIAHYFEPAERNALYHLLGMRIPHDDEIAQATTLEALTDAANAGREGRFRIDVVSAYNFTCALTGYRVTTIDSGSIVDAAHIHQFADSRNNDACNGMALSKNAHWLFDIGLWSLDDDYRIIVATDHYFEQSPDQKALVEYHGQLLRLPNDRDLWPHAKHITWHRNHRFQGT